MATKSSPFPTKYNSANTRFRVSAFFGKNSPRKSNGLIRLVFGPKYRQVYRTSSEQLNIGTTKSGAGRTLGSNFTDTPPVNRYSISLRPKPSTPHVTLQNPDRGWPAPSARVRVRRRSSARCCAKYVRSRLPAPAPRAQDTSRDWKAFPIFR